MKDRLATIGTTLLMLAGLAFLGFLGWQWWQSRLPASYDVMDYGVVDRGGGPPAEHVHFSVSDTKVPATGKPDVKLTLTAQKACVRLASGKEINAWTFNGRSPGPEIRVGRGQLVQVTLVNEDIPHGVTIHWHGVDVPNAEDGVAGVTQNAVEPGERYVYRFRPEQVGTFWYHTHQDASKGVEKGLYGPLVITPDTPPPKVEDIVLPVHSFEGHIAMGTNDGLERRALPTGTPVRLRLINTDSTPAKIRFTGFTPNIVAIDGADIDAASVPPGEMIEIGGGGRYDLEFTTLIGVSAIEVVGSNAGLVISPNGEGTPGTAPSPKVYDLGHRMFPSPAPLGDEFDRTFELKITQKVGFLDGKPGRHWALNGKLYPRVPMFEVAKGDLVRIDLDNDSSGVHPMHLHGHHFQVLSRNGKPVTPWYTDTLEMLPHERYTVAFRADNPGLWMLHCHNLDHAAKGLSMHVMYAGVTTPFRAGKSAGNDPE